MANSLNKVQIIGNITRDIELKNTQNGTAVCTVDIATNEPYKTEEGEWKEKPSFHSVVLWARLAETAAKYLGKGDKVYFEGSLQTRSWEAEDGSKRYKTEIKAKEMIMLGSKRKGEQEEHEEYVKKSQPSLDEVADDMNSKPEKTGKLSAPEDDLPF